MGSLVGRSNSADRGRHMFGRFDSYAASWLENTTLARSEFRTHAVVCPAFHLRRGTKHAAHFPASRAWGIDEPWANRWRPALRVRKVRRTPHDGTRAPPSVGLEAGRGGRRWRRG